MLVGPYAGSFRSSNVEVDAVTIYPETATKASAPVPLASAERELFLPVDPAAKHKHKCCSGWRQASQLAVLRETP